MLARYISSSHFTSTTHHTLVKSHDPNQTHLHNESSHSPLHLPRRHIRPNHLRTVMSTRRRNRFQYQRWGPRFSPLLQRLRME